MKKLSNTELYISKAELYISVFIASYLKTKLKKRNYYACLRCIFFVESIGSNKHLDMIKWHDVGYKFVFHVNAKRA